MVGGDAEIIVLVTDDGGEDLLASPDDVKLNLLPNKVLTPGLRLDRKARSPHCAA